MGEEKTEKHCGMLRGWSRGSQREEEERGRRKRKKEESKEKEEKEEEGKRKDVDKINQGRIFW